MCSTVSLSLVCLELWFKWGCQGFPSLGYLILFTVGHNSCVGMSKRQEELLVVVAYALSFHKGHINYQVILRATNFTV